MKEIWKDIKDYEGWYQVSNLGRVKSLDRTITRCDGKSFKWKGSIVKEHWSGVPNEFGEYHLQVWLNKNGVKKQPYVHQLVGNAFIPNPDHKPIIHHKNNHPNDNRVENLVWMTHQEHRNVLEHRINSSKAHIGQAGLYGERNGMFGKQHTEETKRKMSEGQIRYLDNGHRGEGHPNSKVIAILDNNGNEIMEWGCIKDAASHFGVTSTYVVHCLKNNKRIRGYECKYKMKQAS